MEKQERLKRHGIGDKMKVSIDDVVAKINMALEESGEPPIEVLPETFQGVLTDQLPPYVAEMENQVIGNYSDHSCQVLR